MFFDKTKQLLADLSSELNSYKSALQAIYRSSAIVELNADGTIIDANEKFCHLLGFKKEELLGTRYGFLYDSEYASYQQDKNYWMRLKNGHIHNEQSKLHKKNGSAVWLSATWTPIFNKQNQLVKVIQFVTDITAQVESARQSAAVLDAAERSMLVMELSPDGMVSRINRNYLSLLGYSEAQIIGQHHSRFCAPKPSYRNAYSEFWQAFKPGKSFSGELTCLDRHGQDIWLEATFNPVFDDNASVTKVVQIATDITSHVLRTESYRTGNLHWREICK